MTHPPTEPFGLAAPRSLEVDGATVHYLDEGEGPALVLLHGAPITSLGFARVIRTLRQTHRVLAPDLPGFGGSELPDGFDGTLSAHASFVVSFCHALGLSRFVLFVNDSSGSIGLSAAAHMHHEVAGIVVADTVPIPLVGPARLVKWILRYVITSPPMRWLNRTLNLLPWMVATLAPMLRPFTRVERRALTAQFDTPAKRDRVLDLFRHMATDDAFLVEVASSARARLAHTPALILFGQLDPMRLIGGVRGYQRMLARHTVRIVSFEEHFPILGSGERVGELLRDWMRLEVDVDA